jgi:hypothetical protein
MIRLQRSSISAVARGQFDVISEARKESRPMSRQTLVFGGILILLGLGGFLGTGARSVTALIPAFVGLPMVALGLVALRGSERSSGYALGAAVALALLGFAGAARGLIKLPELLAGGDVERPIAIVMQSAMALVCAVFVALGIRWAVSSRARRDRE